MIGRILSRAAALSLLLGTAYLCWPESAPSNITIEVKADKSVGNLPPIWNFFGYDEPNYSYAPNGKKLLGELHTLAAGPVYVRVHNLLTSGDGLASLKWGSTNVYTEDASGKPGYSWAILDQIFDAFRNAGVRPIVEIGFMPEALSTNPKPYRHEFPKVPVTEIYTGWAYPPKDYEKWSELVFQFVSHLRKRYGDTELKTWLWEVWNEPDIGYWKGTREEYFKLYDFSAEAVFRGFPEARLGGPDTTGPGNSNAADFLRAFLEHCAHGKNYANGKTGSHLDFVSFHAKGSPSWKGDHVEMGINRQLGSIRRGFEIIKSFPEWMHTPVLLGESDPEGCAACSAKDYPQNSYRNGPLYGVYTLDVLDKLLTLTQRENINFLGAVTWAFEFEDQPYFAGYRELATNGVDKPVLNVFRMLGLLGRDRVEVVNPAALSAEQTVRDGVRGVPDIGAIATRSQRRVDVLVWNYHDDDVPFPDASIDVQINGLPKDAKRALIEHFRLDATHSNAFTVWKEMGSPQSPAAAEYSRLQQAGELQLLSSPAWISLSAGTAKVHFALPRQAVSLLRLSW